MFEGSNHPELSRIDVDSIVNHVVEFSAAGIRGYAKHAEGWNPIPSLPRIFVN